MFDHIRQYYVMCYCNLIDDRARFRVLEKIMEIGIAMGDWPEEA